MRQLLLVGLVVMVGGCMGQTAKLGPTPEQAVQNRARPYNEGMDALKSYRASTDVENAHSRLVVDKIAELEECVGQFHTATLYELAGEARGRHASLAFEFAEVSLARGNLDTADRVYRRLIEFYVGNAYSGIRDRARLGVDDVRARRAAAAPKH